MNVQNINSYSMANPSFTAWRSSVYKSEASKTSLNNIKYCTTTCLFRRCPNWRELTTLIAEKYKDVPKINVYDYACSDGSEAYTFLIAMINDNGYDFTKKFTPLIAKDINGAALYRAESKKAILTTDEISVVERYTNGDFYRYFSSPYNDSMYTIKRWDIRPILTDNVKFSSGDVLADYVNVKPENSIVFIRNFWPYLNNQERNTLANGLASQLKDNSLLIIGNYDINNEKFINTAEELLKAGFKETKVDYVFEK